MSTLTSKLKNGMIQIRFMHNGKEIVIVERSLVQALKKVDAYKPVYL